MYQHGRQGFATSSYVTARDPRLTPTTAGKESGNEGTKGGLPNPAPRPPHRNPFIQRVAMMHPAITQATTSLSLAFFLLMPSTTRLIAGKRVWPNSTEHQHRAPSTEERSKRGGGNAFVRCYTTRGERVSLKSTERHTAGVYLHTNDCDPHNGLSLDS